MSDQVQDVEVKNETVAAEGDRPKAEKNQVQFEPLFPILTAMVDLDIDFEETLQHIYKLSGDAVNSPVGWTTLGQDPAAVKKLPAGEAIEGAIYGVATTFMKELKSEYDPDKCLIRSWINVIRKGNHQPRMNFANNQLCGVIILSSQEKSPPVVLHNPSSIYRAHEIPPFRIADYTPFTSPTAALPAKPNHMILWPSWVQQEIPPAEAGVPLIYIAFTVDFLPKGM